MAILPALYKKVNFLVSSRLIAHFEGLFKLIIFDKRTSALKFHLHAVMLMQNHRVGVAWHRLAYNVHCFSATNWAYML